MNILTLLRVVLLVIGALAAGCGGSDDPKPGDHPAAPDMSISKPSGPVCGNGACEFGETQSNCCQDCRCSGSDTCTTNGCQSSQPTPTCGNGTCEPGETQTSCCQDCRCNGSDICTANGCRPKPVVCGNGQCEVGETQSNCCQDCGCAAGYVCQTNTCVVPEFSNLSWNVINSCLNGENIQMRFFAPVRNWVWPNTTQVYVSPPGSTTTTGITCKTGEQICYGARQPNHGYYWGLDIDGSKSCPNCCTQCATATASIRLTCN